MLWEAGMYSDWLYGGTTFPASEEPSESFVFYQLLPIYADDTSHTRTRPPYSYIPVVMRGWVFLPRSHVNKPMGTQGHFIPPLSLLETTRQDQYLFHSEVLSRRKKRFCLLTCVNTPTVHTVVEITLSTAIRRLSSSSCC